MNLQREVRRKILSTLKGDATLSAITTRIYGQTVPTDVVWPFVKLGPINETALRGSCMNKSGDLTMPIHAFAKPLMQNGAMIETAEDFASRIGYAIVSVLDARTLIVSGASFSVRISDKNLMQDGGEADAFHYYCVANVRCLVG